LDPLSFREILQHSVRLQCYADGTGGSTGNPFINFKHFSGYLVPAKVAFHPATTPRTHCFELASGKRRRRLYRAEHSADMALLISGENDDAYF